MIQATGLAVLLLTPFGVFFPIVFPDTLLGSVGFYTTIGGMVAAIAWALRQALRKNPVE